MCARISLYTLSEYEEAMGTEMLNDLLRLYSCPLNTIPEARRISGAELLGQALDVFSRSKKAIGGKLVMVECEIDRPKLLKFYRNSGFKSWTKRLNEQDGVIFDQMFAELNDKPSNGGNGIGS